MATQAFYNVGMERDSHYFNRPVSLSQHLDCLNNLFNFLFYLMLFLLQAPGHRSWRLIIRSYGICKSQNALNYQ